MADKNSQDPVYVLCYMMSVLVCGIIGSFVGLAIAAELGETILTDDPDVDLFTQAGKAWVGGSTGVGVLMGILLVTLYRNKEPVKSRFTSLFSWKPAATEQHIDTQKVLLHDT